MVVSESIGKPLTLMSLKEPQLSRSADVAKCTVTVLHTGICGCPKYIDLLLNLIKKEIKVRYQGTILGYVWSLLNPLAMIILYVLVFQYVMRFDQPNYPLYLVSGVLHWNLFSQILMQSTDIFHANAGILKKIYFPRIILPIANVGSNLILWLLAIAVLIGLLPVLGGAYHIGLLVYPAALFLFSAFAWGLSLILSVLGAWFRDIRYLVELGLMYLFWTAPIIYPISLVPHEYRSIYMLNPLAEFLVIFRGIFYSGEMPSSTIWVSVSIWTALSVICGILAFWKTEYKIVDDL